MFVFPVDCEYISVEIDRTLKQNFLVSNALMLISCAQKSLQSLFKSNFNVVGWCVGYSVRPLEIFFYIVNIGFRVWELSGINWTLKGRPLLGICRKKSENL